MSKRRLGPIIGIVTALALMGAQPAAAATQFGNSCAAKEAAFGGTLASLDSAGSISARAPSSGVITRWTLNNEVPLPPGFQQALKVFRPTGAPSQYEVIGESSPISIAVGANTADTRIPVQTGDFVGASGTYEGAVYSLYCFTANPADRYVYFVGSPTKGPATTIEESTGAQSATVATIEPDADNDGFGDETQDGCPQSASTQAPCPLATLSASAVVRKGLATILITSNVQTSVTVAGKVNLGKGKKANLNGGTQIVTPGTIAKFTVLFPARLKERLKSLSRKQFLKLALTATAPNIAGAPTVQKVQAKAKGQKKPARKGKRGKGKGKGGKRG